MMPIMSRTGGLVTETSRSSVYLICDACEYEQHADANAAVNIAKRFVE